MKILLISGAPNTGKTTLINLIIKYFRRCGFRSCCQSVHISGSDRVVCISGKTNKRKSVRVLINSASDTTTIINTIFQFYINNEPIDYFITSIRDMYDERELLFERLNCNNIEYYEVPLGRITRRKDFDQALDDYLSRILMLIEQVLSKSPFYISP